MDRDYRDYLDLPGDGVTVVLPSLDGLEVGRPRLRLCEEHVDAAMANLRGQYGVERIGKELLEEFGVENVSQLRAELRGQMLASIRERAQDSMRSQVTDYLLESAVVHVKPGALSRIAGLLADRRKLDDFLHPTSSSAEPATADDEDVAATEATAALPADLRRFLVLRALAAEKAVDVGEAEVDERIELLGSRLGEDPDALKATMSEDGTLAALGVRLREEKALDVVLDGARVVDVDIDVSDA